MFKEIIVGIDGSPSSHQAIRIACDLSRKYDAGLTLIHVPHAEAAAYAVGAAAGYHALTTIPSFEQVEAAGQQILDAGLAVAEKAGCTDVNTLMPHGDAATEILASAEEVGADLIVTGRRGLSRISSLVLGSTTQRVSHLAKCACLSVI